MGLLWDCCGGAAGLLRNCAVLLLDCCGIAAAVLWDFCVRAAFAMALPV